MTNTKIEKAVEEFREKWMISTEEGGFMKEDRRGLELYIVEKWLHKALLTAHQQGKKDRDEEVMEWIKFNFSADYDGYKSKILVDDLKTFINEK